MSILPQTLTTTSLISPVERWKVPFTITLTSSDVTRQIELSTDGGNIYFSPAIDVTSASQLITHADSPITHVKVTGVANDILTLVN